MMHWAFKLIIGYGSWVFQLCIHNMNIKKALILQFNGPLEAQVATASVFFFFKETTNYKETKMPLMALSIMG